MIELQKKGHKKLSGFQNPEAMNDREAALRCCRICYILDKKVCPFSDYPEQVALYVKGHVYMGDIYHSKRFATDFLPKVADVVRAEVQGVLKEKLPQTGFMRPVKIVADKDTTKHRTRQVVCVTTVFPEAEDLIQTLFIDHPLIKHHKAEDTAENIYDVIEDFVKPELV